MVAHLYARQNSLACQERRDRTAAGSLECSLTKSIHCKCSLLSAAVLLWGFHKGLLDTWEGCALQSYLQEHNTENKVSEHPQVLVKLWGVSTVELGPCKRKRSPDVVAP